MTLSSKWIVLVLVAGFSPFAWADPPDDLFVLINRAVRAEFEAQKEEIARIVERIEADNQAVSRRIADGIVLKELNFRTQNSLPVAAAIFRATENTELAWRMIPTVRQASDQDSKELQDVHERMVRAFRGIGTQTALAGYREWVSITERSSWSPGAFRGVMANIADLDRPGETEKILDALFGRMLSNSRSGSRTALWSGGILEILRGVGGAAEGIGLLRLARHEDAGQDDRAAAFELLQNLKFNTLPQAELAANIPELRTQEELKAFNATLKKQEASLSFEQLVLLSEKMFELGGDKDQVTAVATLFDRVRRAPELLPSSAEEIERLASLDRFREGERVQGAALRALVEVTKDIALRAEVVAAVQTKFGVERSLLFQRPVDLIVGNAEVLKLKLTADSGRRPSRAPGGDTPIPPRTLRDRPITGDGETPPEARSPTKDHGVVDKSKSNANKKRGK